MSDSYAPTRIIVDLSQESIAAIADAVRGVQRREPRRPMYQVQRQASPDDFELRVSDAIEGRSDVTVRELVEAMGIPLEQADTSVTTRIGKALSRLGWVRYRRDGAGARERHYRRRLPSADVPA